MQELDRQQNKLSRLFVRCVYLCICNYLWGDKQPSVLFWGQIHKNSGANVNSTCLAWKEIPQRLPALQWPSLPEAFTPQPPRHCILAVKGVYLSSIPKGEVDTRAQLWHPIPSHKHLHHLPPQLTLQFPPYLSFILNPRVTKLVSKVNLKYINRGHPWLSWAI